MPNHCSNHLYIQVAEGQKDFFNRLVEAVRAEQLYEFIIPMPECLKGVIAGSYGDDEKDRELKERYDANIAECGYSNWWEFCNSQWGTKWDIYDVDFDYDENERWVSIRFNSAWAPPSGIYDKMAMMDEIESFSATYFESGMCFCGQNINGLDESYEIEEFTVDWVAENIPSDICETMGLYEYAAECEEYEEECED